jgi:hypothetical protein
MGGLGDINRLFGVIGKSVFYEQSPEETWLSFRKRPISSAIICRGLNISTLSGLLHHQRDAFVCGLIDSSKVGLGLRGKASRVVKLYVPAQREQSGAGEIRAEMTFVLGTSWME